MSIYYKSKAFSIKVSGEGDQRGKLHPQDLKKVEALKFKLNLILEEEKHDVNG